MHRRLKTRSRHAAFTVLELLVTVTILTMALFLTLGLSGSFREKTNSAKCAENLRTLAATMFAYAADHNGCLPIRYQDGSGWGGYGGPLWYVSLAPYFGITVKSSNYGELATPGPFACPADKVPWVGEMGRTPSCSYSFPLRLARYDSSGYEDNSGLQKKLASFQTPAQTVLLIDSAYANVFNSGSFARAAAAANDPEETGPVLIKRHAHGLNAVFIDGHIEPIAGDTPPQDPRRPFLWGPLPRS